ncbi:unnamed protein product [Urochloa humidicola]
MKKRKLDLEFDPLKVFPKNSWEEYFQNLEASRKGIDLKAVRRKAKEEEMAKEAQLEAMKALIAELPTELSKGNEKMAKEAQMEAMKSLVHDIPQDVEEKGMEGMSEKKGNGDTVEDEGMGGINDIKGKETVVPDKGKGVVVYISDDDDDWGDDELLYEGDSE